MEPLGCWYATRACEPAIACRLGFRAHDIQLDVDAPDLRNAISAVKFDGW
jgi:hypothetical protein